MGLHATILPQKCARGTVQSARAQRVWKVSGAFRPIRSAPGAVSCYHRRSEPTGKSWRLIPFAPHASSHSRWVLQESHRSARVSPHRDHRQLAACQSRVLEPPSAQSKPPHAFSCPESNPASVSRLELHLPRLTALLHRLSARALGAASKVDNR